MKRSEREPFAHEKGFRDRILKVYESLSPQQRQVADYVLEHLREVAFASVPELAERSATSDATIVRFAQSLGYDGFSGLKNDLAAAMREEVSPGARPGSQALRRTPDADPLTSVAALEIENIERSIDAMDKKLVQRVADKLFGVEHVYTFGVGISSFMADLFAYQLGQIGIRSSVVSSRLTSPNEVLAIMTKRDMLCVFSFPPYSEVTVNLCKAAKQQGILTLAVSDKLTSPVARNAEFTLCTRSDNMMYTNAFAAVSVLLNALVTWAAVLHEDKASRAVRAINQVLETD